MEPTLSGGIGDSKGRTSDTPSAPDTSMASSAIPNVSNVAPNASNVSTIAAAAQAAALASSQQVARHVTVAATQFAASPDLDTNLRKAEHLVRTYTYTPICAKQFARSETIKHLSNISADTLQAMLRDAART